MGRAPIRSLILLTALVGLVLVGPEWPARTTELICSESADQMSVREVLADMAACTAVMGRAGAAGTSCFCSVRRSWLPSAYYLGLMPLVLVSAVWFWSRPAARGLAAAAVVLGTVLLLVPWSVMALYPAGASIPTFLQTMAVFWPQRVFFGPSLYRAASPGLVVPHAWSYISTLIFWAMACTVFGLFVRRITSSGVLLVLAAAFVAATAALVQVVVPLFGWRLIFEGP